MTAKKLTLTLLKLRSLILAGFLCTAGLGFAQLHPITSTAGDALLQAPVNVISMPARPSVSRVSQAERYEELHKRMDKLKGADCTQQYFLHKAQAWHNISREFYHEGIRGGVSDAAYNQAELIIKDLEDGKAPSMETKLIEGADKLSLDLWAMADSAKSKFGTTSASCCAAKETAYCEVSLVRAGYAQANLGGKARTEPLIGIARDVCEAAQKKCIQPVVPAVATFPAVPAIPTPSISTPSLTSAIATKITYGADAFFDTDKSVLKAEGKAKLDDLALKVKAINLEVIVAVGHTDSDASDAYNQKLSVRRADAVKAYLVVKGIDKARIYTEGKGESQPIADNKTKAGKAQNRRVVIEVVGTVK